MRVALGEDREIGTGGEDEGDLAGGEGVGDREHELAVDVDIKDRGVDVAVFPHALQSLGDGAGHVDDDAAHFFQHVLDQHRRDRLVLHQQDAQAVESGAARPGAGA